MNLSQKPNSIRPLTYYSVGIFVVALILCFYTFYAEMVIASYPVFILSVISLLLIFRFGIRFPYIGLVSMERLVQFHLLLTMPLFDAVVINMFVAMLMPFTDKKYRLGSYKVALLRGLNNAAMIAFMLLSAGYFLYHHLSLPLMTIDIKTILVIVLIAVVMQIINIVMVAIFHTIDNKDIKKLLSPSLVLADLLFVPTGVLSALLYQNTDNSLFWLFVFLMLTILFSFHVLQPANQSSQHLFNGSDYQSDLFDINSVCSAIIRRINQLFKHDGIFIGSYNHDLELVELYKKDSNEQADIISPADLLQISQKKHLSNKIIQVKTKSNHSDKYALLSAPFINQRGIFAFICILRKSTEVFSVADLNLFNFLLQRYAMGLSYAVNYKNLAEYKNTLEARVAKRTIALKQANDEKDKLVEELQTMAQRDGLTGLYNRRYFDTIFTNFKSKPPQKLSLALIDIDYFKQVNDQYGHECGDLLLKQFAEILKINKMKRMEVARYGGEEFILPTHNSDKNEVIDYCLGLIQQVSAYRWIGIADDLHMTISIGLAHYPDTPMTDLFTQADRYLYQAKASGRNQLQPPKN